ncbi:MAG: hypothetical protein GXX10_02990 [Clostridiaceae bacterium]|nr:hypothetical protein [Clostridiaceae bacterium]
MFIRPVDYQILMPKVNEIAKVQNNEMQKQVGNIAQQVESTDQRTEEDVKTVHSQSEAQKTVITEREKGRNSNSGKQEKNKEEKDQKESKSQKSTIEKSGQFIDIRL